MDIEDTPTQLAGASASLMAAQGARGGAVAVRRAQVRGGPSHDDDAGAAAATATVPAAALPPGSRTVFMHTFGCGHNVSDGEYMAGQLAEAGYTITDDFSKAAPDCFVINSCTVKNPSEDHFVTLVKKARATGKPVVVAGCVPEGDPKNKQWADVSVVGVRQIDRIAFAVDQAVDGNVVRLFGTDGPSEEESGRRASRRSKGASSTDHMPSLALPKVRRNKLIEIVPINAGCLNFCTYCKTKHARGDLKSWPVEDIVARVRAVVAEGVVEIRMTSEDTGAYGIDIGTDIVTLLRAVVKELEGTRVMLRLGMSNPPYLLRHLKGMCEILQHPNVFQYLHLPVQSGSNAILDVMKREYTVEEFELCCDTFIQNAPRIGLSTDIICAFPGEGESEWEETMVLCRKYKFPYLNISRFYPRRDTPAAAMKQIPTTVSKKRTTAITELYNGYSGFNDFLLGTTQDLWLTEVAHDKHHLVGHTREGFVQVLVDPASASLGDHVTVTITAASKFNVRATVVRVNDRSAILRPQQQQQQPSTMASPEERTSTSSTSSRDAAGAVAPSQREVVAMVGLAVAAGVAVAWALGRARSAPH